MASRFIALGCAAVAAAALVGFVLARSESDPRGQAAATGPSNQSLFLGWQTVDQQVAAANDIVVARLVATDDQDERHEDSIIINRTQSFKVESTIKGDGIATGDVVEVVHAVRLTTIENGQESTQEYPHLDVPSGTRLVLFLRSSQSDGKTNRTFAGRPGVARLDGNKLAFLLLQNGMVRSSTLDEVQRLVEANVSLDVGPSPDADTVARGHELDELADCLQSIGSDTELAAVIRDLGLDQRQTATLDFARKWRRSCRN